MSTKEAVIARLRQEFEGADFDSTRTLNRLRGAIAQIAQEPGLSEDDRDDLRALGMGYMSRFHADLLSDSDRMLMRHGGRVSFNAKPSRGDAGRTRDEAVQPLRERAMSRVVNGAQALGKAVDELSNRQRRLLAAVSDLPDPWPSNRPDRTEGEMLSRHLTALRSRLDWLVKLEEEHGDGQRGVHLNRAERNALIYVLQQFAAEAGAEAAREAPPQPGQRYKPEYIREVEDIAREAIADAYTVTQDDQPGVLLNRNDTVAPITVAMGTWFAVRGYVRGQEDV